MTIKIHHNTAKKAKAHGIELVAGDTDIVARKDGVVLVSGLLGNKVLDAAIAKLGGAVTNLVKEMKATVKASKGERKAAKKARKVRVEAEDSDDEFEQEEGDEGRSVVKGKYKTRYRPFKQTCGDDLAQQVAKHVKVKDEDGKLRVDQDKLIRFAKANDVWDPAYRKLNVGMQRMNCVNRLRAKVRRDGHDVRWA